MNIFPQTSQIIPQVDKDVYTPLIVAAGGGGRGYSSNSESQLEQMDYDPSQPGRNGKSSAAGTLHTQILHSCVCVAECVCLWVITTVVPGCSIVLAVSL